MPLLSSSKKAPQPYMMAAEVNASEATLVNPGYSARDDAAASQASGAGREKMTWKRATEEEKARRNWEARLVTKLRCITY